MLNKKDKETLIEQAVKEVTDLYTNQSIEYGKRVLDENFKPKEELRELQIKCEAVSQAKDIVEKTLRRVL